ncbi:fungal specific transcription factor domain-containing protein [Sporobolomyces koalae]|uniref:fungal specific transcription factor domain-containing protein n=1 Tax=Sporobolomyces koalae TaxID=500713 RepID=UPI00317CAB98
MASLRKGTSQTSAATGAGRGEAIKCSRSFPRCAHCVSRKETCSLAKWRIRPEGEEVPTFPRFKGGPKLQKDDPIARTPIGPRPPQTYRSRKKRVAPEYTSDSAEDQPSYEPDPERRKRAVLASELVTDSSSPRAPPSGSCPSPQRATLGPAVAALPLSCRLERREPRHTICHALVAGETALNYVHLPDFDLSSLSIKLAKLCPSSSNPSRIIFPSQLWQASEPSVFPTPEQASEAIAIYFQQVEPALQLFQTTQSRQYLYGGCQQWWSYGACDEGIEWQALYLATVSTALVVSSDKRSKALAKIWTQTASRIVFSELQFASKPTLVSLRTLLLVLHTILLGDTAAYHLNQALAYLPMLISAAFTLELDIDQCESFPNASSDDVQERRGLWHQVVKLEITWSHLLQSTRPSIDLALSSTCAPDDLVCLPRPALTTDGKASRSLTGSVLVLLSRLSREISASTSPSYRFDPAVLLAELRQVEKLFEAQAGAVLEKAMLRYSFVRLQALSYETIGTSAMSQTEWMHHAVGLFELIPEVAATNMIDRLPALLYILQGAVTASIQLSSSAPREFGSIQLSELVHTLRTTAWPAYMHQTVKRGVVIVEHLINSLAKNPLASSSPN